MVRSLNRRRPAGDLPPLSRDLGRLLASVARQAVVNYRTGREATERPATLREWAYRFCPDAFSTPGFSDMHDYLCAKLDQADRQRGEHTNLLAPRGNAKSQWTEAYALKCAVTGSEPYIWIISHTKDQAQKHLDYIRYECEDNALIAAAYPEASGKGPRWMRNRIMLRNGVMVECYGIGQHIRGSKKGSTRPSLIICDDLQGDEIQTSGNRREKEARWFQDVVMKAGTPDTNIFNVGTALHREAIAVSLQTKPGWRSSKFQAIVQWPKRMDLWEEWAAIYGNRDKYGDDAMDVARRFYEKHRAEMELGAVVLWPEREPLYALMCERERDGRVSFEREKQNNPITPETCYFPDEWFNDRIWFNEWPNDPIARMQALDPSIGESEVGDYSAYTWGMLDRNGVIYVDANLMRRPIPSTVDFGLELWQSLQPISFVVETNQFQASLPAMFKKRANELQIPLPAIKSVPHSESKEIRIRRLEPFLSGYQIRFRKGSPGAAMLVEQLRQFPNGLHDDGPDCLEMLIWAFINLKVPALSHRKP